MSQIFFSYSRKDSGFVDQLIGQLEAQGVDIWVDRGDILAGEAWRRSIVEAIIDCRVFVIVLSPNSVESENVTKELTLAEQYKKRVLPLVIKEVRIPPSLDYQLAGLQFQTFVEGSYEDNYDRLIRSLRALGVVFAPLAEPEPELITEPETEGISEISLPAETPEIEKPPSNDEAPPSQPATESSQQLPVRSERMRIESDGNIIKKIPIWLWFVGGLVGVIGLVVVFSKVFKDNDQQIDPTATTALALVISTNPVNPTATEEIAAIPTEITKPTITPFPPQILDDFGIPMVFVPSGTFLMGAEGEDPDEAPVRRIMLSDFYIDQFEVSNARYQDCVDAGSCSPPSNFGSDTRTSYYDNAEFANYPVIFVNWEDANTYCQWRGTRLPTEAEWEKAARGTGGWRFPWGDKFDSSRANYCGGSSYCPNEPDDGYEDTAPIDAFPSGVSPFGAYQMAGNVNEWVADWYAENYYSTLSDGDNNPQGASSGDVRVIRGGSLGLNGSKMRSSNRANASPSISEQYNGIRCVLGVP